METLAAAIPRCSSGPNAPARAASAGPHPRHRPNRGGPGGSRGAGPAAACWRQRGLRHCLPAAALTAVAGKCTEPGLRSRGAVGPRAASVGSGAGAAAAKPPPRGGGAWASSPVGERRPSGRMHQKLLKSAHYIELGSYQYWPVLVPRGIRLYTYEQIPVSLKDNPYITDGYRAYLPSRLCIKRYSLAASAGAPGGSASGPTSSPTPFLSDLPGAFSRFSPCPSYPPAPSFSLFSATSPLIIFPPPPWYLIHGIMTVATIIITSSPIEASPL